MGAKADGRDVNAPAEPALASASPGVWRMERVESYRYGWLGTRDKGLTDQVSTAFQRPIRCLSRRPVGGCPAIAPHRNLCLPQRPRQLESKADSEENVVA